MLRTHVADIKRISAAIVITLFAGNYPLTKAHAESAHPNDELRATALFAMDGDTLYVTIRGKGERLRLIGIDSPEAEANEKAEKDAKRTGQPISSIVRLGREAARHTAQLVPRRTPVRIIFDAEKRDGYGRLLGYVILPDGSMLNERIAADGYAALFLFRENSRYAARLRHAYEAAKSSHAGLWAAPDHRVLNEY